MSRTIKQEQAFELLGSDATDIFLYGGSRSGKSFCFIEAIIARALKAKSRHVVLRQKFNHVKQSIWHETIPKVMDTCYKGLMPICTFNRTDFFVTLPNGSEIWIGGLDDKERTEKILGKEYSTIFFNECSQISFNAISIAKTRLAEKNTLIKKCYYDANPPRKSHWTYKLFIKKINPDDEKDLNNKHKYASLLMNPNDNRDNIDDNYIDGVLNNLPLQQRQRFLLGEFTDEDDAIFFSSWIQHSEKPINEIEFACKFIAVDPAIGEDENNDETSICVLGIDYDGIIHEVELKHGRWSFNRIVEECLSIYNKHKPEYFGVEYVAFQKALGDVLSKDIPVTQLKADTDKVRRAISVTDIMEQGRVRLNTRELINQLLDFPVAEHDDHVDSFVYCLRMIKDFSQDKYFKKKEHLKHLKDKKDGISLVFWEQFQREKEDEYTPQYNSGSDFGL